MKRKSATISEKNHIRIKIYAVKHKKHIEDVLNRLIEQHIPDYK